MAVSVVIPTIRYNPEMLARCEELVREDVEEVIVAEGGTFAENCNRGAQQSVGDIIVFLNDDTEPQPGWLPPLLKAFADPQVGIAGAKLLYPSGEIQHAGIRLTTEPGWNAHNILEDIPAQPLHAVTGACLAIRRELFEELGGFYEGYRNGAEDVDLCLRAWQHNKMVVYVPESVVIHHESQSGPARWEHINENVELFRTRWAFQVAVSWTGDDSGGDPSLGT